MDPTQIPWNPTVYGEAHRLMQTAPLELTDEHLLQLKAFGEDGEARERIRAAQLAIVEARTRTTTAAPSATRAYVKKMADAHMRATIKTVASYVNANGARIAALETQVAALTAEKTALADRLLILEASWAAREKDAV